jgi:hypothetical protein
MDRLLVSVAFSVLILGLQSCASPESTERPFTVRYADDAGSVTVAPLSVSRWDDVASQLQPAFKMDSATAYAQAIPTTGTLDDRIADLLSANLQVGLPTTSRVRTSSSQATNDATTTSDETQTTRRSGIAPDAGTAQLAPGTAGSLAALSAGATTDDPMMHYLAATALLQEVSLLNRYVTDRVKWPESQAFLVRMQLSVMPNAPNMPYDVETDITLHANNEQARANLGPVFPASNNTQCPTGSDRLFVLPMVVTDSLEGLQAAGTTDRTRQLALAILATAGNVGAGGQFQRTLEQIRRSQGRETNSLFTVGKLSDDTVRVRVGAANDPIYGRVTIPRTHNISLVVIYQPCDPNLETEKPAQLQRAITVVTNARILDPATGQALPYRDPQDRFAQLTKYFQEKYSDRLNTIELGQLWEWASQQDSKDFFEYFTEKYSSSHFCTDNRYRKRLAELQNDKRYEKSYKDLADRRIAKTGDRIEAPCDFLARLGYETSAAPLWTELQSVRPAGQFAYTTIPIQLRIKRPAMPGQQTALVNMDDKEGSAVLSGGRDLGELEDATLELTDGDKTIAATDVSIAASGRAISAKFPPLGGLAPDSKGAKDKPEPAMTVTLSVPAPERGCPPLANSPNVAVPLAETGRCEYSYPVVADKPAAAQSPFAITVPASAIVADGMGHGELQLLITSSDDKASSANLIVSLDGAELSETPASAGITRGSDGKLKIAPGFATLQLANLVPNTIVKVSLKNNKTEAGSVSRSVVAGTGGQKTKE